MQQPRQTTRGGWSAAIEGPAPALPLAHSSLSTYIRFQPRNDRTSPQPLVLFCFGLFWSTRRTNAFCSALPPGYTEVVQESRGGGGAAAGQGSGGRLGPAPHRPGLAGRRRPVGGGIKQKSEVSPTKSALLEVGASRFARPVHSQRADGIDALHRAFASRPYGPCTCLGADLLCAVRLLHPLASPLTSTTNPPTQLSVPAMRAKPQVLVHAMGAETTEVLVVCSARMLALLLCGCAFSPVCLMAAPA